MHHLKQRKTSTSTPSRLRILRDSGCKRLVVMLAACGGLAAVDAQALAYVEASNGDLSGLVASPTVVTLDPGANTLVGTMGAGDFDLMTFTVPAGSTLSTLTINSRSGSSNVSFWAIASGTTWPTGLGGGVNAAAILGYGLFGTANIGTNQLVIKPPGPGALGPGSYTLLIQDTAGSTHGYGFTLTLNVPPPPPVSVPVGGAVLFAGLLVVMGLRRSGQGFALDR